jgi:hypothetical protein
MNGYEGPAVLTANGAETPATVTLRTWKDWQSAPWGSSDAPPQDELNHTRVWGGTAHPEGRLDPGDYTLRLPSGATAWVFITSVRGGAGHGTRAELMGVDAPPFPVNDGGEE